MVKIRVELLAVLQSIVDGLNLVDPLVVDKLI